MKTLSRIQQTVAQSRVNHADIWFDADFSTVVGNGFRIIPVGELFDTTRDDMIENEVNTLLEERADMEDMEKDYQLEK
jgi:hypothetical protein